MCVVVALCAVWPASAAATIDSIAVQPNASFADFLCLGSDSTSAVRLALTTPAGTTLQTLTLPTADDAGDPGCPASTHTFEPGADLTAGGVQPAFNRYPAGARITATQDGRSVTFALPDGAHSAGTTRLRSLPSPATLTGGVAAAGVPGTYTGPAVTAGAAVTATGTVQDSATAAIPITETFTPAHYRIELSGSTVTLFGADPLGSAVAASLTDVNGGFVGRATLRPRVGADCLPACTATATFDAPAPSGGALGVAGQADWFAGHAITLPRGSLRLDGFDVSIPAGDTGGYDFALRFFDPEATSSLAPTSPLRCLELGGAVTCFTGGAPASRLSVSAGGLFVVPGDTVDVTANDPDGDVATVTATAGGLSGSLDDGSLVVRGAPRSLVLASLKSPQTPPLGPYTETYTDRTDESGTDTLADAFSVHIQNGATVTLSGPATGPVAQTFTWKLAVGIDGNGVVRGSTYGAGRVAVDQFQGGRQQHFETTADIAGNFAVALGDVRLGDIVNVAAADPASHQTTTTSLGYGEPTPKITGVSDGQFVRGTITATVAGAGLDSVFWNGNLASLPTLVSPSAPFPYALDTTRWDDGTYRLEAAGRPLPSSTDYLYLTIDNTPPTGSAGADQTVARGKQAIIVTGAADDTSGLASVKIDFGDKHRQSLPAARLAGPITHAYTKLGRFTAVVTITDTAGNVTSDSARIRVATSVTPSVTGHFAGKVVRKRKLSARLTSHAVGQFEIFVLGQGGSRKLTKRVTFTKLNQHVKVTLLTGGLKPGRFLLVEQFTDANGVGGPVQAAALRVVKK